jgi:Transglycosylase SLT domain
VTCAPFRPKGQRDRCSLCPTPWASLRLRYGLGADSFDPQENILADAAYLVELHDRYGAPGFIAAYNTGSARYEAYLTTGRPLPDETRAYIGALAPLTTGGPADAPGVLAAGALSWTEAPLFVVHTNRPPTVSRLSPTV